MTAQELSDIREESGFTLPPHYVRYLESYPQELRELYYDHKTWRCHICDEEFLISTAALIKLNREFRQWPPPTQEDRPLEHQLFWAIGSDVGGNYYLIRVGGDRHEVYFYDHETAEVWPMEDDLDDFAAFLVDCWKKYGAPKGKVS